MKQFLTALFGVFLAFCCACSDKPGEQGTRRAEKKVKGSCFQLSYQHGGVIDSIVLDDFTSDSNALCNQVSIYRKNKLLFTYADSSLGLVEMPYSLFVEHEDVGSETLYYIFKEFNAPHPSNYFVISVVQDKASVLGRTLPSTAEIFGDADADGRFEIGGWTDYCQEDETHKCPDIHLYRVFEVALGFPTDTTLTQYFRQTISANAAKQK